MKFVGLPFWPLPGWISARTRLCGPRQAGRRGAAGFDPGGAGYRVDHDPFAMNDVLALADHDIAAQRDGLGLQVIDAKIAARILVLGDDGDAAARFDAADVLRVLRHARRRFGGGRRRQPPACRRAPMPTSCP